MHTPILGSSYVARSVNAAANRMVNLFPEVVPEGGKEPAFLNRAPGLAFLQTVGTGPIRGLWAHQTNGSDFYVVSGTEVYKLTSTTGTPVKLGNVSGTGPVSIADNGTQIFFACNGPSYIYNEVTNVFQQITDVDFPGAKTVGYLDGYFVFNEPSGQRIWVTSLIEGTQIDPLDFASASTRPDPRGSALPTNPEGALQHRNACFAPCPLSRRPWGMWRKLSRHWHALLLWLKKVPFWRKPEPPQDFVTR
jgi:hypothetical protein